MADRGAAAERRASRKRKLALIAYLLARVEIVAQGITDANGLTRYFLVDVNMDPCMMTSRIVQAVSAVQLFVQRSLLNLETGSILSPQSALRWEWMKNFRVWEADRKVFLYPENWIRRSYATTSRRSSKSSKRSCCRTT